VAGRSVFHGRHHMRTIRSKPPWWHRGQLLVRPKPDLARLPVWRLRASHFVTLFSQRLRASRSYRGQPIV
jgi:hypothetical protein